MRSIFARLTLRDLILIALLAFLGYAYHAVAAPLDAGQYDASMSMSVGKVAAPVVAKSATTAIPPSAPVEVPIQELVALALTLLAFSLRRFSPGVALLHTPGALALVSTGTALLTAVAGAIAHQGLSVRVVLLALTAAMTSALAQANTSPGGTGALLPGEPMQPRETKSITERQTLDTDKVAVIPLPLPPVQK